ncbi:MAG: hypothetical protein NVS1B10_08650 [Candidatus Saccharimonadales bacterium]
MTLTPIDDATYQKHEELEHQRLSSLINSMADAVIAVDENIKIVIYNAATLNILDLNNIKNGTKLSSVFRPIQINEETVDIDKMIKKISVSTATRDLRLGYPDGSKINLYLSIAPVHLGYGQSGHKGYVLLLRDITREKSLEEERDEFISVVSHELRTPIAIAEGNIGNAEFVVDKTADLSVIKQSLKEAHNQVLFLADMINDLSTLSRAERGKLHIDIDVINVHELISELASNYTPDAKAKNLIINVVLDPKLELLKSSKLYVREILQNFITNAIKYTDRGQVTLRAYQADNAVRFEVSDSGIGISKSDQSRVFDKFFRSEDYRTRKANGTGLGLYVTMKLATLVHAEISLDSQLNRGTTFKIVIPNLAKK